MALRVSASAHEEAIRRWIRTVELTGWRDVGWMEQVPDLSSAVWIVVSAVHPATGIHVRRIVTFHPRPGDVTRDRAYRMRKIVMDELGVPGDFEGKPAVAEIDGDARLAARCS